MKTLWEDEDYKIVVRDGMIEYWFNGPADDLYVGWFRLSPVDYRVKWVKDAYIAAKVKELEAA